MIIWVFLVCVGGFDAAHADRYIKMNCFLEKT